MDKNLSEQQELLLYKAAKDRDGKLSMTLARNMYSSNNSAKNAVTKLEMFGYIENYAPGYFRIKKLPNHIKRELAEDTETETLQNDSASSSNYEIKQRG